MAEPEMPVPADAIFERRRRRMVDEQLASRDIHDDRILAAFERVPRHLFVDPADVDSAYDDHPLPIGHGATISQPYIVALMMQSVMPAPTDRVLDVGAGSGYSTAILAELAADVTAIERVPALAHLAADRLAGYGDRVRVLVGDGSIGYPEGEPYDVIAVAAGATEVPRALTEQLAIGGRLVIPVGRHAHQNLQLVSRSDRGFTRRTIAAVRFVPLVSGTHAARDR